MKLIQQYTTKELTQLRAVLYDILSEIIRICDKHDINYFAIGGTAIGALYDKGILPWDDDVDIGMTRKNYNKFLAVAPSELKPEYFLSWLETDPHTPFNYAKIKKNGTTFIEDKYKHIKMHHGIFVDIFPFDNVPDSPFFRKLQFKISNFLKTCFMAKDVWMWKHFGSCDLSQPLPRSIISTFACRCVIMVFSKYQLYRMLEIVQTWYNNKICQNQGLTITEVDYFTQANINKTILRTFGPLMIKTPNDIEAYMLQNSLKRFTEEEGWQRNHYPYKLEF